MVLIITLLPLQRAEAATGNEQYMVNVETKLNVPEKPSTKGTYPSKMGKVIGQLQKYEDIYIYNTSSIKENNLSTLGRAAF